MAKRRRWCGWCMLVGIALFLVGVADAMAATGEGSGPGWEAWFTILVGLIVSLIGAHALGMRRRIEKVEDASVQMQRAIDRDMVTYTDLEQTTARIERSISALHRRLDFAHFPQSPQRYEDNGA